MNKELIKKYKDVFDHWLNGGKVLSKYTLLAEWSDCQTEDIWRITSKDISKILIVINDEYVEFRKALVEGKIIQVYDIIKQHIDNPEFDEYGWKDFKSFKPYSQFTYEPNRYRIKPEEPKFKVGDWTVNKTSKQRIVKKVTSVYSDTVTVGDSTVGINVMSIDDLELWEPKEGDICWFISPNCAPILAKFVERAYKSLWINNEYKNVKGYKADKFGHYSGNIGPQKDDYVFPYCEPFIGQLPTNIKKQIKD